MAKSITQALQSNDPVADIDKKRPQLLRFTDRIEMLVKDILDAKGISVASIVARVKDSKSLAAKLNRLDRAYRSTNDLTDICGVRVIAFYADDVDRIANVIRSEFQIDERNSIDKRLPISPDRFGYSSLHYVVSLKSKHSRLTENKGFAGMSCEIQIRSILQHAWAEIEHDLGYKSSIAVPDGIRRRFSRLASLFELSDDEFVGIRRVVESHRKEVANLVKKFPEHAKIDEDALCAFARFDPMVIALDREITGMAGVHLETKRPWGDSGAETLKYFGLKTIRDVRAQLKQHLRPFRQYCINMCENTHSGTLPEGISLTWFGHFLATEGRSYKRALAYVKHFNFHLSGLSQSGLAKHMLKMRG